MSKPIEIHSTHTSKQHKARADCAEAELAKVRAELAANREIAFVERAVEDATETRLSSQQAEIDEARAKLAAVGHEQDRERHQMRERDCDALCRCAAGRHCEKDHPCFRHALLARIELVEMQRDAANVSAAGWEKRAHALDLKHHAAAAALRELRGIVFGAIECPGVDDEEWEQEVWAILSKIDDLPTPPEEIRHLRAVVAECATALRASAAGAHLSKDAIAHAEEVLRVR